MNLFFALAWPDYAGISAISVIVVFTVIQGLMALNVITPVWQRKLFEVYAILTGTTKDKRGTILELTETMAEQTKELHKLHKKKDDNKYPEWFCRCAVSEIEPEWGKIVDILAEIKRFQKEIKAKMDELDRTSGENISSMKTVYQQLNQLLDSLIKKLE